jgi:hypothetical protein
MVVIECGICRNGANSTSLWRVLRRCTYRPAVDSSSVSFLDSTCTLRIAVARLRSFCQNVPHVTLSHRPVGNYHIFWISPSKPTDSVGSSAYSPRNGCGYSVTCYRACKVPDLLRSIPRRGVLLRATRKHGRCQPYSWDESLAGRGIRTRQHDTSVRLPSHTEFLVAMNCYCQRFTTQLHLVGALIIIIIINTVKVMPIVISSTGIIPISLSQCLKTLNLHPNTYIQMQIFVILDTCSIVRNFLNHN